MTSIVKLATLPHLPCKVLCDPGSHLRIWAVCDYNEAMKNEFSNTPAQWADDAPKPEPQPDLTPVIELAFAIGVLCGALGAFFSNPPISTFVTPAIAALVVLTEKRPELQPFKGTMAGWCAGGAFVEVCLFEFFSPWLSGGLALLAAASLLSFASRRPGGATGDGGKREI